MIYKSWNAVGFRKTNRQLSYMKVGTRLIFLKPTVIPTVGIPVWWLEIGWFRVDFLQKATKARLDQSARASKWRLNNSNLITMIIITIKRLLFYGLQKMPRRHQHPRQRSLLKKLKKSKPKSSPQSKLPSPKKILKVKNQLQHLPPIHAISWKLLHVSRILFKTQLVRRFALLQHRSKNRRP